MQDINPAYTKGLWVLSHTEKEELKAYCVKIQKAMQVNTIFMLSHEELALKELYLTPSINQKAIQDESIFIYIHVCACVCMKKTTTKQ